MGAGVGVGVDAAVDKGVGVGVGAGDLAAVGAGFSAPILTSLAPWPSGNETILPAGIGFFLPFDNGVTTS
jgi:hypothetical protein